MNQFTAVCSACAGHTELLPCCVRVWGAMRGGGNGMALTQGQMTQRRSPILPHTLRAVGSEVIRN